MLLMMMIAMDVLTVHLDDYHEDGDDPSDDDSDYGDDGDVYEGNQTGRQAAAAGGVLCSGASQGIFKYCSNQYCTNIACIL